MEIIKRLLILLVVIGLVTAIVITIGNSTTSTENFPAGGAPGGLPAGQAFGSNQPPQNRPEFQGAGREPNGGGVLAAELIKNLGIITIITVVIVLFRKILAKVKPARKVMNE